MILNQTWLHYALLSAGFAALTAIFAKLGVADVDSDVATFIRTLIVAVLTALLLLVNGKAISPMAISARTWSYLALSGAATGASWLCYFKALQLGKAASVAPVDKLSVVFVAVFAALFLGEKLTFAGWFGVAMIAGGAVLIALKG